MNLGECFVQAIQKINEYSNNGALISPTNPNYIDYKLRMPGFANDAQMEIARFVKIPAVYSVSQPQIPNLLGLHNGFDIELLLPVNGDKSYTAIGAKSYYIEVDRPCTITIVVNGTTQKTINVASATNFISYKGNITASASDTVTMMVSATQPVQIRNRALFAYNFGTDDVVPTYQPYVPYTLPSDFMELDKIIRTYDQRQLQEWSDYKTLGKRKYGLNWFLNGQFEFHYYRYPTAITAATPETYEFEIDIDAQQLIPYYIAAHVIDENKSNIGQMLLAEYQNKLANLSGQYDAPTTSQIQNVMGW